MCDTLMGKGGYDGYDPLYTGMIGMHGTKTSNLGVSECDLLVALGARFSDRVVGNASLFAKCEDPAYRHRRGGNRTKTCMRTFPLWAI